MSKWTKLLAVSFDVNDNKINSKPTCNLHSVYLIAAAGSASIDPKLPCPLMRGHRREKS